MDRRREEKGKKKKSRGLIARTTRKKKEASPHEAGRQKTSKARERRQSIPRKPGRGASGTKFSVKQAKELSKRLSILPIFGMMKVVSKKRGEHDKKANPQD